jgi:hypothetical protein
MIVDFNGNLALANTSARSMFGINLLDLGHPLQDLEISYPEGKVRQNWTTFSSPGFGIANFSFLAGKTSYLLITKLGLLTIKMLVLPRLSNFVQFHWTRPLELRSHIDQIYSERRLLQRRIRNNERRIAIYE